MKKRLLSISTAMCMILSLLPWTALAADPIEVNYDSIDIYVKNRNVWKSSSPFGGCYGLLDFEGDGIPELFSSVMSGSGRFSENHYYKIDINTRSVYEMKNLPDGLDMIDLLSGTRIYQDNQTGQPLYYYKDITRSGIYFNSTENGLFYMQNGTVYSNLLWYEKRELTDPGSGVYDISYYTGSGDQLWFSESEWEQYKENYLAQYTLIADDVPTYTSSDMNKASDANLKKILSDMYDKLYPRIKVILNGSEISFDQPPIMQNDRVLVPIRKIAEAMGDDVLWDVETSSAMIKHGDRALIIRLNDDKIEIADDKHSYTGWERKPLDVPAQIINDRTLVPLRAFCESLSSVVEWNGDEKTVYITYDSSTRGEELSTEAIENINIIFKLLYKDTDDLSFSEFSTDMGDFYNTTSKWKSAFVIGLSDIEKGVKTLLDGLMEGKNPRDKNTQEIVKASLAAALADIPDNPAIEFDAEDSIGFYKRVDDANKILEDILGNKAGLLSTAVKALDTAGKTIDWSAFTVNQLSCYLNDYSVSIDYLNAFKENCDDDYVKEIIDEMLFEYSYKWAGSLYDLETKVLHDEMKEELRDEIAKASAEVAAAAIAKDVKLLYDISKFTMDIWNDKIGLNDLSKELCNYAGTLIYNTPLDTSYSSALVKATSNLSGSYENMNKSLTDFKYLFKLEKSTKIKAYQHIKEITNDAATKTICDERIAELNQRTYMLWQ